VKIRAKTILILSITLIVLLLIFVIASETIVLNAFHTVEVQSAQKDTNRALSILGADINQLDAVAQDWASRDSLEEFIMHEDKSGLLAGLDDQTLEHLRFNYIIFYNTSGNLIAGTRYDTEKKEETPIPAYLATVPLSSAGLSTLQSQKRGIIGMIGDRDEPILLAVQPVYGANATTTPIGYILMARYLDASEILRLENLVQLPFEIRRYNDPDLPDDYMTAIASFQNGPAPFARIQENDAIIVNAPIDVSVIDNEKIGTYALIRDINGSPLLVLHLIIPRDIYAEGKTTTVYFLAFLIISGTSFGAIILLLLDESILFRLMYLSNRVNAIGAARDFSARISVTGTDEMAQLATDVNTMLAELELSQQHLKCLLDQREKSYRLFFNSITDPVLVCRFSDQEGYGTLIEVNEAAVKILGYSRDELADMRPVDLLTVEGETDQESVIKQLISQGEVQFEGRYLTRQGTEIPVEVTAHLFTQYGEKAVLTISRDITERKDIERLKMEAFQQIEKNMQQFAILNDKIRNPLQGIIGVADLMDNSYKEKFIQMATMINEIVNKLDQGYIESEKIHEFLRKYYGVGKK
jgi:PAS domain S-box-containing protein